MDIELKDYGKSQHLEERVVELVEAAGMQNDIATDVVEPAHGGEHKTAAT